MDKESLVRREYHKHLKNNLFPALLLGIGLLVISGVIILINLSFIIPIDSNLRAVSDTYSHIVESNNEYDYPHLYQFEDLITIKGMNGKAFNSNIYMLSSYVNGTPAQTINLSENEIALSRNIANALGIKEGDIVNLDFSFTSEMKEYKVVAITPYIWNHYEVLKNIDFSVAYIGYKESVKENSITNCVYFLDDKEYSSFQNNEYSYKHHYFLENDKQELVHRIAIITIVFLLVLSAISIVIALITNSIIKSEVTKYFYDGYNQRITRKFYIQDFFLFYGIEQLLVVLISACLIPVVSNMIPITLSAVLVMLLSLLIMFKGVHLYGKAH